MLIRSWLKIGDCFVHALFFLCTFLIQPLIYFQSLRGGTSSLFSVESTLWIDQGFVGEVTQIRGTLSFRLLLSLLINRFYFIVKTFYLGDVFQVHFLALFNLNFLTTLFWTIPFKKLILVKLIELASDTAVASWFGSYYWGWKRALVEFSRLFGFLILTKLASSSQRNRSAFFAGTRHWLASSR